MTFDNLSFRSIKDNLKSSIHSRTRMRGPALQIKNLNNIRWEFIVKPKRMNDNFSTNIIIVQINVKHLKSTKIVSSFVLLLVN